MGTDQKRLFMAVILSAIVLFAWQSFMMPKNPVNQQPTTEVSATPIATTSQASAPVVSPTTPSTASAPVAFVSGTTFKTERSEVEFSSDLSIVNFKNNNARYDIKMEEKSIPFKIEIFTAQGPAVVPFTMTINQNQFSGVNDQYKINLQGRLDNDGKFRLALKSAVPYKYRLVFTARPTKMEGGRVRQFLVQGKDLQRLDLGSEDAGEAVAKWFGIDYHFYLLSFVMGEKQAVKFATTKDGIFYVELINPVAEFSGYSIFTKKIYDELIVAGDNLHLAVDFGFFGVVAVPILRGLQLIYRYIPNYGIAIILLTIIIRTLMFPLQYKSFKSMKKMQKIQPEIAKIKEKFKDDPMKQQKETMELFKRAGANPLSGCLPILAQMPIFFAFYSSLNNAVELVGAPFYGWIQDLSLKDPYYVFPVLMTISMFVQQKLTPATNMDPVQQKIMTFMPLIFGFIMKDLPAGLVLYIFVSTIYGIGQQMLVYKVSE